MREFKTTSLADQVFDRLEENIIMGVYPRGETITELKLVEELGVSRTPIREALRRLAQERLIEDTPRGTVVLGITEEDLMDIMNIREHVEALASYHAAVNASQGEIDNLKHMIDLQSFYCSKQDIEHMRQMDDEFHDAIAHMGGRNVVRDTLLPLHRKTQRFRKTALANEERNRKMIQEHEAIYNAIAARCPEQAARATAEHVRNAREHMKARFLNHE